MKWELNKNAVHCACIPTGKRFPSGKKYATRVIGPESPATTVLDGSGLKPEILPVLPSEYALCISGVVRTNDGYLLRFYDQYTNKTIEEKLPSGKVSLRATGNYEKDIAQLSFSTDGNTYINIGDSIHLPYQLKTFQGSRYALFAYNTAGKEGGYADFEDFKVIEPLADRSNNILGKDYNIN
jgi:hypothetical protein